MERRGSGSSESVNNTRFIYVVRRHLEFYPVADGQAGSSDPLSVLKSPPDYLIWRPQAASSGPGIPSEVLFAGLAPGLVGVYQIDLRVPRNLPNPVWLANVPVPVAP